MDVKDEAVGEDGEEGGETFDGMNEGNGNLSGGGRGQDMAAYLEHGKGEGGAYDVAGGVTDAMPQNWNGLLQRRKEMAETSEGDAPRGNAGELDDGKSDWLRESVENCLRGCVGEC